MNRIVERTYLNELPDEGEYLSMQISGTKYSFWDKKHFGVFNEGMPVKFKFKRSGKYLNISDIEENPDYKPENHGNNNSFNYPNPRDLQIMKTSCLKCATYMVKDLPLEVDKKLDLTLDVAKKFEKYRSVMPSEEQDSPLEDSPDQGNFDGEF